MTLLHAIHLSGALLEELVLWLCLRLAQVYDVSTQCHPLREGEPTIESTS